MVSSTIWIVFAQLVIFNPEAKRNENELTEFRQREFPTQSQCHQFLQDNYVFLDTALKRHAERRNGRVIILGCGDRAELSEISSDYDRRYGRS